MRVGTLVFLRIRNIVDIVKGFLHRENKQLVTHWVFSVRNLKLHRKKCVILYFQLKVRSFGFENILIRVIPL